jgi:hypothetical protein
MKNLLLCLSVILNVALLGVLISKFMPEAGGFQFVEKGDYVAMLSDVAVPNFGKGTPMFYRFKIYRKADKEPIVTVDYRNRNMTIPTAARDIERGIAWSEDAKEVSFSTPVVRVILKNPE